MGCQLDNVLMDTAIVWKHMCTMLKNRQSTNFFSYQEVVVLALKFRSAATYCRKDNKKEQYIKDRFLAFPKKKKKTHYTLGRQGT